MNGACVGECLVHASIRDDFGSSTVSSYWSPSGAAVSMGRLVVSAPSAGGNNGLCMTAGTSFNELAGWVRVVSLSQGGANTVTFMTVADPPWTSEAALEIHADGTFSFRKVVNGVRTTTVLPGTFTTTIPATDVFPTGVSNVMFHFGIREASTSTATFDDYNVCP